MPQLKTKTPTRSRKSNTVIEHPALADASNLIGMMLDYEATPQAKGIDLASGRFSMLTESERQFLHATLVADYIRLSAGNLGNTPGYFDFSLDTFCRKICDTEITSNELIGTYLAAVDVVTSGKHLSQVPGLIESVRGTMINVLHGCVKRLGAKLEKTAVQ